MTFLCFFLRSRILQKLKYGRYVNKNSNNTLSIESNRRVKYKKVREIAYFFCHMFIFNYLKLILIHDFFFSLSELNCLVMHFMKERKRASCFIHTPISFTNWYNK